MITDPVCQMDVDDTEARKEGLISLFDEQTWYFCSRQCKREFDMHPAGYTTRDAETRASEEGMPPSIDEPM
jgi:YHS domain-containing protein